MYSLHYGETGILLKKSLQITEPFVKLQNTFRGHVFSCQSESRAGHLTRTRPGKLRSQKLAAGPRWRVTFRWLCRAWRGGSPAGQMPRKPELRAVAVTTTETSERWPGRTSLAVSTSQTRKRPVCDPSPGSKDCGPLPLGGLRVRRGAKPIGDGPVLSARVRQRP